MGTEEASTVASSAGVTESTWKASEGLKLLRQPVARAACANLPEPLLTTSQDADSSLCCLAQELQCCNPGPFNVLEAPPCSTPTSFSLAPHSPARVAQGDLGYGGRHRVQPALGLRGRRQAPAHSALAAEWGASGLPGKGLGLPPTPLPPQHPPPPHFWAKGCF